MLVLLRDNQLVAQDKRRHLNAQVGHFPLHRRIESVLCICLLNSLHLLQWQELDARGDGAALGDAKDRVSVSFGVLPSYRWNVRVRLCGNRAACLVPQRRLACVGIRPLRVRPLLVDVFDVDHVGGVHAELA